MRLNQKQVALFLKLFLDNFRAPFIQDIPDLSVGLVIAVEVAKVHPLNQPGLRPQEGLKTRFLHRCDNLAGYRPKWVVLLQLKLFLLPDLGFLAL